MSVLLWMVLAIGIVSWLTYQINRSPLFVSLIIFLGLPIVLSIYWSMANVEAHLFQYVKVYSVSLGALLIVALRYKNWINLPWMRLLGYLLLILNILEAMVAEAVSGGIVNVITGGLLILSQAFPAYIHVGPDDKVRNLRYDLGLDWILAYTIWNFTFVYGFAAPNGFEGDSIAFAICHLLVPLLLMEKRGDLYMQARAYSLAIFMMVKISLPYEPFIFLVPDWYSATLHIGFQWISLFVAMFIVSRTIIQRNNEVSARNVIQTLAKKILS